jgi:hypothetical protein
METISSQHFAQFEDTFLYLAGDEMPLLETEPESGDE